MPHVIIKVLDVDAKKELKLEGEDAGKVAEADKVEVTVTPVGSSRAVVVITCEH